MISIVIPAFDEEESIQETVKRCFAIRAELSDANGFEVIVTDDGSSDHTGKIAADAGARVIRHPHNIGYGGSLKSGINAATNDIILITDSDGTYPVESIPALLNEFQKGYNMVVGARHGKNYDESLQKKMLRIILKWMVEFTAGRKIDDINSGFRIFSRKEIIPYFNQLSNSFSFTTSLTLAYMMTSKFVKYIPIEYHKRVGKSKVRLFRDSLRTMQFIVEAITYYNPIKIFLLISFILLVMTAISFTVGGIIHSFIAMWFGITGVALAVIFFGMGLIATLLKQIMHKPQ